MFIFKLAGVHSLLDRCVSIPVKKNVIEVHIYSKIRYSDETNFATNSIQQLSIPAI